MSDVITSPPIQQLESLSADSTLRPLAKVAHVINGEFFSGAERVQDLLGKCLPQFGYDVNFVCLKPGQFAESVRRVRARSSICRCATGSTFGNRRYWQISLNRNSSRSFMLTRRGRP